MPPYRAQVLNANSQTKGQILGGNWILFAQAVQTLLEAVYKLSQYRLLFLKSNLYNKPV